MASPLPAETPVLSIGLHPSALDYSTLPAGVDEASLTARFERGNAQLRAAGFNVTHCLVGTAPDAAEAQIRSAAADASFGLAMIGGGIRMMPEHTELFERVINVLTEVAPGIRLCFNTAPDDTVVALRRHLVSGP